MGRFVFSLVRAGHLRDLQDFALTEIWPGEIEAPLVGIGLHSLARRRPAGGQGKELPKPFP